MLKMFENRRIYIAPKLKVNELLSEGKEEELIKLIEQSPYNDSTIDVYTPEDFVKPIYLDGLKHDNAVLEDLVTEWDKINYDPKLDVFLDKLKNQLFDKSINREGKLVVFSESKETTDYLLKELEKQGYDKVLSVESSNRTEKMPLVSANFDANYKGYKKDNYNIVLTTEVLAEGVNLHRANVIVNYDTPWNSTRLMQRIGRVNRIGSTAKDVYIYNFFPTKEVNNDIELENKAKMKLFAFHAALGEDSQIYSEEENPESFGLFDKNLEEERDEKLGYLMWLRKQKEEYPDLLRAIEKIPLRARVGRIATNADHSTLVFIRNEKRDAFTLIHKDGRLEELTFLEAVKIFKADVDEKAIPLHELNEKRAIAYLDSFLTIPNIDAKEAELIRQAKRAITTGRFQQLQRKVNKLKTTTKKTPVKLSVLLEQMIQILSSYPLVTGQNTVPVNVTVDGQQRRELFNPEVIISESFCS